MTGKLLALVARLSVINKVIKSNNQFRELSFHGGFKEGRESLGKLVLLLLLYNALTRYSIMCAVFPQKKVLQKLYCSLTRLLRLHDAS